MDYFYDGQVRRYLTQFMRVFVGVKWADSAGNQKVVPVKYGDPSRQASAIIRENSENKTISVPQIACYIDGLDLDTSRLSDPTFVSKVNIRERRYDQVDGNIQFRNQQGGNYTVERLMPTPFKLTVKADLWTSNIQQKLQILEQIAVFFNPSLELQTTDNYLDWTSLSVIELKSVNFSSRSVPQGVDTEIDVCTLTFEIPVWITPPAKVKKLGIVKKIIANVFTEEGAVKNIDDIIYNNEPPQARTVLNSFSVVLLNANNGQPYDFNLTIQDPRKTAEVAGLESHNGDISWWRIIELGGGYKPGDKIYFKLDSGYEIFGTYVIDQVNPRNLLVSLDPDSLPSNTEIVSNFFPEGKTFVDAIIDPTRFNPTETPERKALGVRYLTLETVRHSTAWLNNDGSFTHMPDQSIIEWDGDFWVVVFDPSNAEVPTFVTNDKSGVQYRWNGEFWVKSFEGEYGPCEWGVLPDDFAPTPPADFLPEAISAIDLARSLTLSYVQGNSNAEASLMQAFQQIANILQQGPNGNT